MKTPDLTPDNPQRLAEWIMAGGRKRSWVARKLGVNRSTVTHWCSGKYRPDVDIWEAIEKLTEGAVPAAGWLK